jgi:hypothetical protein
MGVLKRVKIGSHNQGELIDVTSGQALAVGETAYDVFCAG